MISVDFDSVLKNQIQSIPVRTLHQLKHWKKKIWLFLYRMKLDREFSAYLIWYFPEDQRRSWWYRWCIGNHCRCCRVILLFDLFYYRYCDRYLRNSDLKSNVHVIKHINFQLGKAYPESYLEKLSIDDKWCLSSK